MAPRREVAESCLEFLYIELVQSYERKDAECAEKGDGRASRAALESIGFQALFVLQDDRFRWLRHLSLPAEQTSNTEAVAKYLVFPCGLIK
eukprot:gene29738-37080_t